MIELTTKQQNWLRDFKVGIALDFVTLWNRDRQKAREVFAECLEIIDEAECREVLDYLESKPY